MNCPTCGTENVAGSAFCDGCGSAVATLEPAGQQTVITSAARGVEPWPGSAPAASQPPAPDSGPYQVPAQAFGPQAATLPGTPILMGDGEVLWRQYGVLQLRTKNQGEGLLFVTDSRVVFYARAKGRGTQRPSALIQQTKLEHITGLTAFVTRQISMALIFFTCLFSLLVLINLITFNVLFVILCAIPLVICAVMLASGRAKRGTVGVRIQSGAAEGSAINFGQFGTNRGFISRWTKILPGPLFWLLGVFTAFDVLFGLPGEDSDQVIAELGALIFDLQSRGNLAGLHWGVQQQAPSQQAYQVRA